MRFAFLRIALLTCVTAALCVGQQSLPVAKLVEFVKSSISQKLQDRDVALYLAGVRLTQKLDDQTVEDLQTAGAGPKTVAALNKLVDQTAQLSVAAPIAPAAVVKPQGPPPPSADEWKTALEQARENSLNYSKNLPDFICMQVTRRSVDMHYQPGQPGSWSPADRFAEKLSYFDQHEKYELITHNDTALLGKTWETLGGSMSRGEFGSVLLEIFDPASAADIHWLRWGTMDKHLCHVFEFRIDKEHSRNTIEFEKKDRVTPAYHGLIFVQKGPNVVLSVRVEPDIPTDFPVQDVHQQIDYRYTDISGHQFLLPFESTVQMRNGRYASKNDISFRQYKKYSADTSITFDDTDDPPADAPKPAPKKQP